MAATLRHRGPDDHGIWSDMTVAVSFGHARLSIIDISAAGHQPMTSASGRYVIAFNGEIYNHLDLRAELDAAGRARAWRGHSDTETLLAAFEVWDIRETVTRAVGMFAIAVWDRETRTLTLVRDRVGEKPLFYGWQGGTFLFGSELKALRAHPAFAAEIDRDAVAAFMRVGYVPAPRSIYRGIRKLPPGTLLRVRENEQVAGTPEPYWSLLDVARAGLRDPFTGSDAEAIEALTARLSTAVSQQQLSDVPLGAFLSGGVDSSTIVAMMQAQASRAVRTFTIGFQDEKYDESPHARAIARHLGTDHTELVVTSDEARGVIPRLPQLYDEPFADASQIPTFLVSGLARRSVTVSLSGDGGDELFGGYNRYMWTRRLLTIPAPLRRVVAAGLRGLTPSQWDRVFAGMHPILPAALRVRTPGDQAHKLAPVLAVDTAKAIYQRLLSTWPEPVDVVIGATAPAPLESAWEALSDSAVAEDRMMAVDAVTYLPDDILCKVDRAAMGVSLETRVPFLDHRVVEFAWQLPLHMKIRHGQGKWLLRQLLYRYVPAELIERPKMGFGVPIDAWLRGPLREWAEELLAEARLVAEGYLHPQPIRQKWVEHLSGRHNWQYQLWNVLMFQSWLAEHRA